MRKLLHIFLFIAFVSIVSEAHGQYYDLGRSPFGIKWNRIDAKSGRIIYPSDFRAGAANVASLVDTLSSSVSYGYKFAPLKLPTILHTQNFISNGLVLWAPKRMEFEAIPTIETYALPWLKQLTAHEYRHAAQYGGLYKGFMRPLSYLIGQQSGMISLVLVPLWFLEGDATMFETQSAPYGRGLQPSFTIEYRAYLTEGKHKFNIDKWFSGSYKDFIPNHYQFGYQVTSWSREKYGDDMWGKIITYASRNAFFFLPTTIALRKFYKTTEGNMGRETLKDLTRFWKSLPVDHNSGEIIKTPTTSYTTYNSPMRLNDSVLVVLKKDMDRPSRFVTVNRHTGAEKLLLHTGSVSTPPLLDNGVLYWSEFRSSLLWEQQVFSRAFSYDITSGRKQTFNDRKNALYPTPLPGGVLATVGYHYSGFYSIDLDEGRKFLIPDTISVHGLAYDQQTETLAFIGLSDAGMALNKIDLTTGEITPITKPSYVTIYNLRAGAGRLAFNSIASGKDEIHIFDLAAEQEYRLTTSTYGSVSPSVPTQSDELFFTTYTVDGYRIASQTINQDSLERVEYMNLPKNVVNPPRRKWDVADLGGVKSLTESVISEGVSEGVSLEDSITSAVDSNLSSSSTAPELLTTPKVSKLPVLPMTSVVSLSSEQSASTEQSMHEPQNATRKVLPEEKRYRQGLNLFNLHSWAPWAFNPNNFVGESSMNIGIGATVMSQNLLSNTFSHISYAHTSEGSLWSGSLAYYGLAPKFEFAVDYGGGSQTIYGLTGSQAAPGNLKRRFQLRGRVYMPLLLSSGSRSRQLTPSIELMHLNARIYDGHNGLYDNGYQRMIASLTYTENTRMATRDLQPRWGYAVKVSNVSAPFTNKFSNIVSVFGRLYTPGLLPHHAVTVRGNFQEQQRGDYNFYYKELFPRGALYHDVASRYGAVSLDYHMPVWYPDGGISSILFFTRMRVKAYYDFARYSKFPDPNSNNAVKIQNVTSYGGELIFDMRPIRIPVNDMTIGIYVYKPSNIKGVVTGVNFALPL